MSAFRSTYGSSDIGDTGMVPRGLPLNGGQPAQHLNGSAHESPSTGRPSAAPPPPVGDNKPTFQDNADQLIRIGRLITSFKRIGLAIRDRRCERSHLLVLYAIMEKLNEKTGTAFPSRKAIATQEDLGEKVVENAIYELRLWGYVDWERRAEPDLHKGRLLHYTLPVLNWTDEDLVRAILSHRETLKARSPRPRGTPPTGDNAHGVPRPRGQKVPRPRGPVTY